MGFFAHLMLHIARFQMLWMTVLKLSSSALPVLVLIINDTRGIIFQNFQSTFYVKPRITLYSCTAVFSFTISYYNEASLLLTRTKIFLFYPTICKPQCCKWMSKKSIKYVCTVTLTFPFCFSLHLFRVFFYS